MKNRILLLAFLLSGLRLSGEWVPVFTPDFSGEFQGEGPNQFNYAGSALNGEFVQSAGVHEGRFRMVTKHAPEIDKNHSITRLSRHGDSTPNQALDIGRGAALVRLEFRWKPTEWAPSTRNVLDVQIGESFRTGTYNPARGGRNPDGPAFAAVQLQAQAEEGQFRLMLSSAGPGTPAFRLPKDAEGFYTLRLSIAFNNTKAPVTVSAPGGPYTLKPVSLAVWNGNERLWDNVTDPRQIRDADLQHVSFGFGNGTDRPFAEAEAWAGIYEIGDISVLKWVP